MTEIPSDSRRLTGKVAVITGGARGQGECEAKLFAQHGAIVYVTDVLADEGKKVAEAVGGHFIEHDVTDPRAWSSVEEQLRDQQGRCDILVNNAGIFRVVAMQDTDLELWQRMIDVNQTGVFLGMQTMAPLMTESESGSIINISSIAGLRGSRNAFAYSATKWAVRGMTKAAALELADAGVRVNSIHPGIIKTPMINEFDNVVSPEDLTRRIPLGHVAEPEEVAKLALFLASDDSAYCTGSEFVVDGGWVT